MYCTNRFFKRCRWSSLSQQRLISSLQETDSELIVSALGTIEVEGKEGVLKLLVEGEQVYDIEEELWTPLQGKMVKLPFYVKITVKGKRVTKAELVKGEDLN